MSVLATIEPADLQVEAGSEVSLVVRVRNRGSIVDRFDVAVVGPTSGWASVDQPSLRLFPDKDGEARVTFRPPRAPNPAADTYPFGISVRAASDASASTVEEGRITVAPFVQLTTEIVPQTSRGSRVGTHDVTVHNVGNTVAEVSVRASDPDRLLDFEVSPQRAGLRPDASATVRTRVKPKQTFLLGSPKRIPFTVSVDEPTAGSYPITATMEQRAIIPSWVKPAAGLAVAAIAAILLLPPILFPPTPSAEPSQAAVVTPTPEPVEETPAPVSEPPEPTEAPTPETFGPPDTLTAAGDETGLTPESGLSFKCAAGDACRDDVKARILQILANLSTNAEGARLVNFSTTIEGTLPVVAEWDNRYKYTVNGTDFFAKAVAVDLAPKLAGAPAYVYIRDDVGTTHWYTVPDATAELLLNDIYNLPAPVPTPNPGMGGGGVVLYDPFYDVAQYNGIFLQGLVFAPTPAP